MATFSGTAGSVVYSFAGSVLIEGIGEWSLDFSMSPPEATTFGDSNDVYVPSVRTATGSFSGNADTTSSGQDTIQAKFLNGDVRSLRLYESASKYFDCGTISFTGLSDTVSVKGKGETSYNFQVHGLITYV